MLNGRLQIFVSSKMEELAAERLAIKAALVELLVAGWGFEDDAGARAQSIQQTYRKEIETADLYVGVFWRGYGEYTIDEFNWAGKNNKERLIYEKRSDIEGKRDAKLQTFLDEISKVETGLTIRRFNTPEELSNFIKDDVALWLAGKVRERSGSADDKRALRILLGKVKHFWVEGMLDRSIERLLELNKEQPSKAVENSWEAQIEIPNQDPRPVLANEGMLELFESVQNSLLILGQPGSGKTITLLLLVRDLINRAEQRPGDQIPVVFVLSSWTNPEQPLASWLEAELNAKYQIPTAIGKKWLAEKRLLLLLDGLDEVKEENRATCVKAINQFVKETGSHEPVGLVVCCRAEQYEELHIKLALTGAISLRPLTDRQIEKYIDEAGGALAGFGGALRKDPVLQELARSPLLLNLMCKAYGNLDAAAFDGRESMTDRTRHLFATYIDRMFAQHGTANRVFPREQTLAYLAWIATGLVTRNQTMFLMEELQPGWFSSGAQRWAYLIGVTLVLGLATAGANIAYWSTSSLPGQPAPFSVQEALIWLVSMPAWYLAIGWAENIGERAPAGIQRALLKALIMSLTLGIVLFVVWMFPQLQGPPSGYHALKHLVWAGSVLVALLSFYGRNRSIFFSVKTVESVGWSAVVAWRGALIGLVGGLALGRFVYLPFAGYQGLSFSDQLVFCLGFGTVFGALGALLGGFEPRVYKGKTGANQGIRFSLKMALFMGLNAIWLMAIVALFAATGHFATGRWVILGWLDGMFTSLFLWFGGLDVIKHYVLRAVLTATGKVPWDLGRLLDNARDLNLMQKVGNGYMFWHRRLLEYMAAGEEKA
jgi:DNA polymerase III delta prime subunit